MNMLAAAPKSANCWGKLTSQRATTLHDIGELAAAQEEPSQRPFHAQSGGEFLGLEPA